jgi:hypothetical protein
LIGSESTVKILSIEPAQLWKEQFETESDIESVRII